jgi:hypothetical protein
VSLCRLGAGQAPATTDPRDHVEFWLIDQDDANNDLAGVVRDAAAAVRQLRGEDKTVFVHCVHAQTRTPVVTAAYGALITVSSFADVLRRVRAALPSAAPRGSIVRALQKELP